MPLAPSANQRRFFKKLRFFIARRFWVVIHCNGHVWPETFSFHRSRAIAKFLALPVNVRLGVTWRKARREGYRVFPVHLTRQ